VNDRTRAFWAAVGVKLSEASQFNDQKIVNTILTAPASHGVPKNLVPRWVRSLLK
jgi:hypothetical protein